MCMWDAVYTVHQFVSSFYIDPAAHQLTFDPDCSNITHYCHQLLPEPSRTRFNSVSLQLVPPIPSEGTLLVAHPDDGRNSFSLRVQEGRVVFEYQTTDNVTRRLMLDTSLERSNTLYQIDLSTTTNEAEVVLQTVNATGPTTVERLSTGNMLYSVDTIFTTVCMGGSLLEYASYVGTIRSAFYGYNSLLEERNFCRLKTEGVSRSDLVVFADNDVARSLMFERFTLRSHRIVLQARSRDKHPVGFLLLVENLPYHFSVGAFNAGLLVLLQRIINGGEYEPNFVCTETILPFDGEWHTFEISLDLSSDPSITVTVDGNMPCATETTPFSREALPMLADLPLQFGATDVLFQRMGMPAIFTGCVSGIELQLNSTSEIVKPNLEAAPRLSSGFDVDTCYHCESKFRSCENGHVCTDRGLGLEATCECSEGFRGEMCAGKVSWLLRKVPMYTL